MQTLRSIHDADKIQRLGLVLPTGLEISGHTGEQHQEASAGYQRLESFFTFLYELCSARCWSQIQFAMMCPQFLAICWHESRTARITGLAKAQSIWQAMLAAEGVAFELPGSPEVSKAVRKIVKQCLDDCAWHELQVSRESYSVCRAAHWQPADEQLRILTHRLFGRPCTTKYFLEDCFNHCSDLARRHAKGMVMQRLPHCITTDGSSGRHHYYT